jgi:hypothetical protein
MDERGAVDLRVVSCQLQPRAVDQDQRNEFSILDRSRQVDGHLVGWAGTQLTFLLAASILESYLLHLRGARLTRFDLVRHPDAITLGQLAHLRRWQPGVAGQSFEIAIADSVNAGISEIVNPIRQALRLLNINSDGPIGMVLLGLEKVSPDDRRAMYDLLSRQLPIHGRLRGGGPGRPPTAATALKRLSDLTWHSMRAEEERYSSADAPQPPRAAVSQLGRADALLYCGTAIVPVSMKIRGTAVDRHGWRDVPLWITTTTLTRSDAYRSPTALCPTAVVRLARTDFYASAFLRTVEAVDNLLSSIDRDLWPVRQFAPSAVQLLCRHLRPFVDRPLRDALEYLRTRAHPAVAEIFGDPVRAEDTIIKVPTLNNPVVQQAFTDQATDRQLFTVQNHLWVPPRLAA